MRELNERLHQIAELDAMLRQLTWQCHKQMLHTLSRPELGLTMPQLMTLFAIRDARTCRMSELADVTNQSAGTLTGIVDRLIDDNLVGRLRDTGDRRVVQVMLTPEGERRLVLVEQLLLEDMAQRLTDLSNDDLREFSSFLRNLIATYQEPELVRNPNPNHNHNGNGAYAVAHFAPSQQ